MKKIAIALLLAGCAPVLTAGAPAWLSREFSQGWNIPGHGVEEFLNDECQPSGLDGLQLLAVQNGHGSPYNLHVYCRQDGSKKARYRVTMITFAKGKLGTVNALVGKPNLRVGPFYFGDPGQEDGTLIVEKIH